MAQTIKSIHAQEYHEKMQYHTELPPTPSSSAFSFLASDQKEESEKYSIDEDKKPLNTTMPTTNYYGSINAGSIYSLGQSSSAASTISPNDDDEGLYLLWTHQLLREKGFKPSSCRLDDNDDDDDESTDSSITGLSYDNKSVNHGSNSTFSFFKLLPRNQNNDNNNSSQSSSSWFSCFPMC